MTNVHALFLVKNEVDVVGDVIRSAARWATGIHILDNNSDDGTWEELQRVAKQLSCVNLLGRETAVFRDELRAEMFQQAKHNARGCEWWVKLDADEFHMVDPRGLLRAVAPWSDSVFGSMYQYYLTDLDAQAYAKDAAAWLAEPLRSRVRWYENNWAELKAVRNALTSDWLDTSWPAGTLRVSSLTLPIQHYQYRSPDQVARRLASRLALPDFVHERDRDALESTLDATDWRKVLRDHSELDYDDGNLPLIERHAPDHSRSKFIRSQVGWAGRRVARSISRAAQYRRASGQGQY